MASFAALSSFKADLSSLSFFLSILSWLLEEAESAVDICGEEAAVSYVFVDIIIIVVITIY